MSHATGRRRRPAADLTPLERARRDGKRQYREPDWPPNLFRYTRGGGYFFERRVKGAKRPFKKGLGKTFDAAKAEAQRLGYLIDVHGAAIFAMEKQAGVTIADHFANFHKSVARRSKKTQASYRNRATQFQTYLHDRHPSIRVLGDVTAAVAEGYFEWRADQDVTRSGNGRPETPRNKPAYRTLKDDLVALRFMFQRAVDKGLLDRNPFSPVRLVRTPRDQSKRARGLSAGEIKKLLAAAAEYDREKPRPGNRSTFRGMMHDIIRLFLVTGLRKKELIYLPWKHVDFDSGVIYVESFDIPVILHIEIRGDASVELSKLRDKRRSSRTLFPNRNTMERLVPHNYATQTGDAILKTPPGAWDSETGRLSVHTQVNWTPKASEGHVPLIRTSKDILARRRKVVAQSSPFVFPHPDGGPLRSDLWAQFNEKVVTPAGLRTDIRIHDLRHTFGFTLREKGVALETISALMRHRRLEDTLIYAKPTRREGATAIKKLEGYAC